MSVNQINKDDKVVEFLNDLMVSDEDKYELIQALRKIVNEQCPSVSERIIYGGIMFSLGEDFGGVFPYKNHVSFEFGQGCRLEDSKQLLEGKGKYRRYLKLTSKNDVEVKQVRVYIKQALELLSEK